MEMETLSRKSITDNKSNWHHLALPVILSHLNTSVAGLTTSEAAARLRTVGRNEFTSEEPPSFLQTLILQFSGILIWILIVAAIVAAVMGEWIDCLAILAIVILNSVLGAYQEHSAERSILALKNMTVPSARVRREGASARLPGPEVVPGDILELEAGDLVPADARLIEAFSLKCVESALTGESEPVEKLVSVLRLEVPLAERVNILHMGTVVAAGSAVAVVTGTGHSTEVGQIAELIDKTAKQISPLQRTLETLGRQLAYAAGAIVIFLFLIGFIRGLPLAGLLLTSISLAVAAIPEGLPAVLTIAMGLGVRRMAQRGALIRKLPAVETLGSTNVICTDKTGTLTVGQMTARALYLDGHTYTITGDGYSPRGEVLEAKDAVAIPLFGELLATCNTAAIVEEKGEWKAIGDPTEAALLVASKKIEGVEKLAVLHDLPFDSDRKRRSVICQKGNERVSYTNGAPEVLLPLCSSYLGSNGQVNVLNASSLKDMNSANAALAAKGFRVLASAYRTLSPDINLTIEAVEQELTFVGFTAIFDPPRKEAKAAVKTCHSAGINVVMITGDQPTTAIAIARELGIADGETEAVTGSELDTWDEHDLRQRVISAKVYARVTAAHKLLIVNAWQSNSATVAMTGDGVNDAPALKGADVGIAMGRGGTEVAKQASAMIITDDNFATIVAAIEEGRGVYANIQKSIQYLLAGNVGELIFITACLVSGLPMPLLPIHLLWINLVTDGLPALCLASDPISSEVMCNKPRPRNQRLADRKFIVSVILPGTLTAACAMVAFLYGYLLVGNAEKGTTYAFAALVFAELLRSFGARSETEPLRRLGVLSNLRLFVVVLVGIGIQVASHHIPFLSSLFRTQPVHVIECIGLLALGSIPLVVTEWLKERRVKLAGGCAYRP